MGDSLSYSMCKLCGSRHPNGAAHIWKDEPKGKIAAVIAAIPADIKVASELPVKSLEKPKKEPKSLEVNRENSLEMRHISVTELYRNLSKELLDLPFEITRNGNVIAVVRGK